ncbi:response regulator transcription factor [Novosphingopyxis sp. YJ-S2-01]|nr:response regulator transcription factor [Novosphingopyxis sp. YJ-S2-01]MBH9538514.1 response regulator transcription factor [Novosphingopyxis sp. YJ-S2-01]
MSQGGYVLIADDHPLTREGLALAARAAMPGVAPISAGTVEQAEQALASRRAVRLILLDFVLPDSNGYSGFMRLQMASRSSRIVIVSGREEVGLIEAARALGAAGFIFKSDPLDNIAEKVRRIDAGASIFPSEGSPDPVIQAARQKIANLSPSQLKVLVALADGRLNKQIAADLDITEATVKAHLTAIFRKLGVTNRTQALLAVQPLIGNGGLTLQ